MGLKKNARVFIGPVEIAGYYGSLAQGLNALGLRCDFVEYQPHRFGYQAQAHVSPLIGAIQGLKGLQDRSGRLPAQPLILAIAALRLLHFLGSLFVYDVYIFGFARSLLPRNLDLPILRLCGKRVLMNVAHGTEMRPPYISGALQSKDGTKDVSIAEMRAASIQLAATMTRIEANVDIVIGGPFSSTQFASLPMVNWFALGMPVDYEGEDDGTSSLVSGQRAGAVGRVVRILHSPSHPAAKGSVKIREAVDRLRARGHAIDYVELTNRPNSEVIAEIRRCDLVVDQLYSDTPMAKFPAEAAWYGKPAIVGGYGLDYLKRFVPEAMWPPSYTCHPDQIEAAIEALIRDPERRQALGRQARQFVREKWKGIEVARRFLRLIEGDIPEAWWIRPEDVEYHHGAGQTEEATKRKVRAMVGAYGVASLQLVHRPALERSLLDFAGLSADGQPVARG